MRCCKCNSTSNVLVCESERKVYMYGCVIEWAGSVCGVCVSSLLISSKMIKFRCLYIPHQVNNGGVQKAPAQVSLYKSHTTEVWTWSLCSLPLLLVPTSGWIPGSFVLTLTNELEAPTSCEWGQESHVTRWGIHFSPWVLHYINEVLCLVSSWRLQRVGTVPCHTRFPTCGVLSNTFCTHGLRLLTHRFPTRIIWGSPDLFAFVTLSRIRISNTFADYTSNPKVSWGL